MYNCISILVIVRKSGNWKPNREICWKDFNKDFSKIKISQKMKNQSFHPNPHIDKTELAKLG